LLIGISGKPPVSPTHYFTLSSWPSAEKYFGLRSSRRGRGAIAAGFPERSFDDHFLAGVEFRHPLPKFRLFKPRNE
jgi:hypothetical protein